MGYLDLKSCVKDLLKHGELVVIEQEFDPRLEIPAIQRRVFKNRGPALLFKRVKGSRFPMLGNIFGTKQRVRFIFRDFFKKWDRLSKYFKDPRAIIKDPRAWLYLTKMGICVLPKVVNKDAPVTYGECKVSDLPCLISWPKDGGGYITLPQVYTEDPDRLGFKSSNLGMYRIQLSGNEYIKDKEVGLHYQIHRGIGVHHQKAIDRGIDLKVNIFIGGPPAMTLAAIMPLPEGIPEVYFAGILAGHRIGFYKGKHHLPILRNADFCIVGHVKNRKVKPEGPFGDHMGYYSLVHDFPVLTVEKLYYKKDAIWPFTTVGRPPQEDSIIGEVIHEIVGPFVKRVFNGVQEIYAVDAAGVHPLLLAIARETYVPFESQRLPQEIITCGLSLLGSTQTSLSKYVIIAASQDNPYLSTKDIPGFFSHVLKRIDLSRDLHFITRTTMDTLDYSGISLNQGSKIIISVAGEEKRTLSKTLDKDIELPQGFSNLKVFYPGILLIKGPRHKKERNISDEKIVELQNILGQAQLHGFPLVVVVDDVDFTAKDWDNFLWVTFTRSDPATDIYGGDARVECKHWGCSGPLIIDARLKTYHAPPLEEDQEVVKKILKLGERGGPLHGII